jgi:non-homologous end joining protein Ku
MVMVEPRGSGMTLFTLRAAEEVRAAQFGSAEGDLDVEMVAITRPISDSAPGHSTRAGTATAIKRHYGS